MRFARLFVLSFLLPISAFSEVMWMDLRADIAYRDPFTACSQKASFAHQAYLAMEVDNGAVVRGRLKKSYALGPSEIELDAEEVKAIDLQRDPQGAYWMKRWAPSPRLVVFLLRALGFMGSCLPAGLASVDNAPVFDFRSTGLGEDLLLNLSEKVKFTGKRKDGQPFKAEMLLHQRNYQ